jgi:glutamate synthase (NADPH/NADH) small chain
MTLTADVLFKAIGQKMVGHELDGIALAHGRIVVDDAQATTLEGVWAGGDCVVGGEDLTVSAVQDGKVAAIAIDRSLRHG